MKKARIVIADLDENYILPLEENLLNVLSEDTDIELITDQSYLDAFLVKPTEIDLLIVSSELFRVHGQFQYTGYVIVLTETLEESFANCNISGIYKYTSISEICKQAITILENLINKETRGNNKTEIITITSASGGVGKTTIAASLCLCLEKRIGGVLYINAENVNTFQYLLQNKATIEDSFLYAISERSSFDDLKAAIKKEGFDYLPPLGRGLVSIGQTKEMYLKVIRDAKDSGEYNYIVVDTDSVLDEVKISLLTESDRVFIISSNSKASVVATKEMLKNISHKGNDKFVMICNDCTHERSTSFNDKDFSGDFDVIEHIEHINDIEVMSIEELSCNIQMIKTSYLI